MNVTRILTRSSVVVALMALAACQTPPARQGAAAEPADAATAPAPAAAATQPQMQEAAAQGAPVAVFLADMVMQEGWRGVNIGPDTTLYLDPRPVITHEDLTSVRAGPNKQGQGLLVLMLRDDAQRRLDDVATRHPNKRFALAVGTTLMAVEPVRTGNPIFLVSTEQNALAAARAIAGVDESGAPMAPTGAGGGSSMPQ